VQIMQVFTVGVLPNLVTFNSVIRKQWYTGDLQNIPIESKVNTEFMRPSIRCGFWK